MVKPRTVRLVARLGRRHAHYASLISYVSSLISNLPSHAVQAHEMCSRARAVGINVSCIRDYFNRWARLVPAGWPALFSLGGRPTSISDCAEEPHPCAEVLF